MSGSDDTSDGARDEVTGRPERGAAGRPDVGGPTAGASGGVDTEYYGKLGGGVFGVFALGLIVTWFLFVTFGDSGATFGNNLVDGTGGGNELFAAVTIAFVFLVLLGPLVALGLGVLVGALADDEPSVQVGAVTAGIGVGATFLALVVLLVVLAPDGASVDIGELLGPVVGATVGIAATGGGSGYVADELLDR